ncbi:MAG: 6-hydroxycyclohex-1-ene-1-carbonyl-CoA dehydrogenase [Deltaproteobacteria bacterium]|nr:6-hydroxycyclohex-1-ene-1-carbonyl-CoA dehydrogenase [Deltaproteobacteria bacterium]
MPEIAAQAYFLKAAAAPLERERLALPSPGRNEAIVEILACGLCHTDLSYASGAVPTKHPLPLVLGHEAVGRIAAAGADVLLPVGTDVLIPAVLPCGVCALCRSGRGNACADQKMPGNDIHGGFSTHMLVPAAPLVSLAQLGAGVDLRALSVVADAVSTAYQAVRRAGVGADSLVVTVGAGGVGGFVAQVSKALGARVIACDVKADRLAQLRAFGAEHTIDVNGKDPGVVRKEVRGVAKEWRIGSERLAIFECSGTSDGQLLAFALLERAATLLIVGYTPKKVDVRLSNLMAFDAQVLGSWGCPPEAYPAVLELIRKKRVVLDPFIDYAPMSRLNQLLTAMSEHKLERRMVLDPKT